MLQERYCIIMLLIYPIGLNCSCHTSNPGPVEFFSSVKQIEPL